jgi:hypothetical protein
VLCINAIEQFDGKQSLFLQKIVPTPARLLPSCPEKILTTLAVRTPIDQQYLCATCVMDSLVFIGLKTALQLTTTARGEKKNRPCASLQKAPESSMVFPYRS